jgi:predicted transcriptional regulator
MENTTERNRKHREFQQAIEELLRVNPQGLKVSEIAFYLGVDRTRVHRTLPTLEDAGIMLWEDQTNRYGILEKRALPQKALDDLNKPIRQLEALLDGQDNAEANYQQLFQHYPWIFGTYYKHIVRHQKFDDENIPDFLGIRAHDDFMDIIEIKPPFMKLFRADGTFSSEFNDAWNQAERYVAFAQLEADYLKRKGLRFENSKCLLVAGYNIPEMNLPKLRTKQRLNPWIQVMTYEQVLAQVKATVDFVRRLNNNK